MTRWLVLAGVFAAAVAVGQALPTVDSVEAPGHLAWYGSRAAGIVSYLLLWVGLAGGLLMSSAWFDGFVLRARLLAIHQAASIAGVVFGLLHGLVLIADGWTSYTLVSVLVPFASSSERALTGLGTVTLYLFAIVAFSFWFRSLIGPKTWKRVHYAGFAAYAAGLFHGIALGSDTHELWATLLYAGTGITTVFAIVLRVTYRKPARRRALPSGGVPVARQG